MYRVVLVHEHYGRQVVSLAQTAYVWLVQSPDNDPWARRVWEEKPNIDDPLRHGLTTFDRLDGENLDEVTVRLIGMIDEHHGEYAHEPAWQEIEVVGAPLSKVIRDAAAEYGVDRCEPVPGGFRLHRGEP